MADLFLSPRHLHIRAKAVLFLYVLTLVAPVLSVLNLGIAEAATAGANNGSTFANDATVGTVDWVSPSNAQSSDDSVATVTLDDFEVSKYLRATDFGFSIPGGATIDGIEVEVERQAQAANKIKDSSVKIVKNGTIGTQDKANVSSFWDNSSEATVSYGSSVDLWGETWSTADVNSSTFGVVFAVKKDTNNGSNTSAYVDHIKVTVYYTDAGSSSSSSVSSSSSSTTSSSSSSTSSSSSSSTTSSSSSSSTTSSSSSSSSSSDSSSSSSDSSSSSSDSSSSDSSSSSSILPACVPNDPSLLAYWKFDDGSGTDAIDSTGNGNDGQLLGMNPTTSWVSGVAPVSFDDPTSLEFSNPASRVRVTEVAGMDHTQGTVSLWANPDNLIGNHFLFSHVYNTFPNYHRIYINQVGDSLKVSLGNTTGIDANYTFTANAWHHIVLRWENGNYWVSVNGTATKSGTYNGFDRADGIVNIGQFPLNNDTPSFSGKIDDVRVYDRAIFNSEVEDLSQGDCESLYDFGDAPDSYSTLRASDGPGHVLNGPYMGSLIDDELDGQPSGDADEDDTTDDDDEDGVTFFSALIPGGSGSIAVEASEDAKINAWIDLNQDGDFDDAYEQVFTDQDVTTGSNVLTFPISTTGAVLGETFMRFRINWGGGLSYEGLSGNGEVEDYKVELTSGSSSSSSSSSIAACEPYAGGVISFDQGKRKDGSDVLAERSDPNSILNDPLASTFKFLSLGFDGEVVVELDGYIENGVGDDFQLYETTGGNRFAFPLETADVYGSTDGVSWVLIGELTNHSGVSVDSNTYATGFDIDGLLSYVRYLKLIDTTDPDVHANDNDGIDVAGVNVLALTCDEPAVMCVENGAAAYWKLDEDQASSTAADSSGNGNDGTYNGSDEENSDKAPLSFTNPASRHFDGSEYVDAGDILDFTTNFSVSAWVNPDSLATDRQIISRGYDGSNTQWELKTSSGDGKVSFRSWLGSASGVESSTALVAGEWTHVVGTYDGTTWRIYMDGSIDNTNVAAGPVSVDRNVVIGAVDTPTGFRQNWVGFLDDVRVYDRVLTEDEIDDLYNGECTPTPSQSTDLDFGDAPDSYSTLLSSDGARHVLGGSLYLGSLVDAEADGQPSADAYDDDDTDTDDEDGVTFSGPLSPGLEMDLEVEATEAGYLNAWVDFNQDGDFDDAGEQVFTDEALSAGMNSLSFDVGSGVLLGETYARFRLDSVGGLSFDGLANDGEVEDYRLSIVCGCELGLLWQIGDIEASQSDNPADEFNWADAFGVFPAFTDPFVIGTTPDDEFPWNSNFAQGYATDFDVEFEYTGGEGTAMLTIGWAPGGSNDTEKKEVLLDGSSVDTKIRSGSAAGGWWSNMERFEDTFVFTLEPGSHTLTLKHLLGDGSVWDYVRLEMIDCSASCGGGSSSSSSSDSSSSSSVSSGSGSSVSSSSSSSDSSTSQGNSSSSDSSSSDSFLFTTAENNSGPSSNGSHRGGSSTLMGLGILSSFFGGSNGFLGLGGSIAPGGFGGGSTFSLSTIPPGSFGGGPLTFSALTQKQKEMICKAQTELTRHVDRLKSRGYIAALLANLLGLEQRFVYDLLGSESICDDVVQTRSTEYGRYSINTQPAPKRDITLALAYDGYPLSTNEVWNSCIRNMVHFDENGDPYNCSRWHEGNKWTHPDIPNFTFEWNERDPRGSLQSSEDVKIVVLKEENDIEEWVALLEGSTI